MVILNIIKKPIIELMKAFDIYSLFLLRMTGALKENGWFRSFRERRSVDAEGNSIPWLTYPAINFIESRLRPNMRVFEYGTGDSTIWWAEKVKEVIACEHDIAWYNNIIKIIPSNVTLNYIPIVYGGAYCHKVAEFVDKFDIIVIDGRDRVNCVKNSLKALKSDGVIIWDNCDRQEYDEGYQFLFDNGFRKIEFIGMIPIVSCKSETGIFYKSGNCLGI